MPRKPNYRYERIERERLKAEKKAARAQARADRKSAQKGEDQTADDSGQDAAVAISDDTDAEQN